MSTYYGIGGGMNYDAEEMERAYEPMKAETTPEVIRVFNVIEGMTGELDQSLKELEIRLAAVMRPEPDNEPSHLAVPREALYTALAGRMDETVQRLRVAQVRVRSMLDRLEV